MKGTLTKILGYLGQKNFNFYYHSVDILPGPVILLKDNQLKMQEITPNTEQLKGRKLL